MRVYAFINSARNHLWVGECCVARGYFGARELTFARKTPCCIVH